LSKQAAGSVFEPGAALKGIAAVRLESNRTADRNNELDKYEGIGTVNAEVPRRTGTYRSKEIVQNSEAGGTSHRIAKHYRFFT